MNGRLIDYCKLLCTLKEPILYLMLVSLLQSIGDIRKDATEYYQVKILNSCFIILQVLVKELNTYIFSEHYVFCFAWRMSFLFIFSPVFLSSYLFPFLFLSSRLLSSCLKLCQFMNHLYSNFIEQLPY